MDLLVLFYLPLLLPTLMLPFWYRRTCAQPVRIKKKRR
jgi:hypothetical protein